MPSFTSREAVPPVERISIPSASSPRAKSARPVLSETLIRARATVMTRLHTTGGMKRRARPHLRRPRLLVVVGRGRARLVVRDHPQLRQAAHLQLANALSREVHDHADLLQRDT